MTRPFPLHTGIAEVTARTAVTPSMARLTLSHPAFADFGVERPGEIITLGWCDEGEELVMPLRRWRFPPGTREQHWRNYTVRAYRPEQAELDVDFFLHGDLGRAAAWGERARPGDTVGFAGPRLHWKGVDGNDWSLLVADETGLPALLAILETLPAGHRAIAI
ncbi:MAG TPA: siderophore-interacting protein, partial [Solirubrobacteraceae bacterium]|nr:siderophore-interacting protein [Solirubrobacteraceae bacterium]